MVEGTLVKLLPLRMRVSSGVVGGPLRRISPRAALPSSAETHVTVTAVLSLPVESEQLHGEREGEGGQRHTAVVKAEKAMASASPQIRGHFYPRSMTRIRIRS